LPTGWTHKLINFAGVPAWRTTELCFALTNGTFNAAADMGRVDNVRVLSWRGHGPHTDHLAVRPGS
jgi:hypothetical protein